MFTIRDCRTEIYRDVTRIIDQTGGLSELRMNENLVEEITDRIFKNEFIHNLRSRKVIIHVTHTDADGVGCGVVFSTAIKSIWRNNNFSIDPRVCTFCVNERISTDMLRMILTVYSVVISIYNSTCDDMRYQVKASPDFVCVSDLNLDPHALFSTINEVYGDVTLQSLSDMVMYMKENVGHIGWGYKVPLGFLYIDHHETNSLFTEKPSTRYSDPRYRYFKSQLENHSIIKPGFVKEEGRKVSATYIMANDEFIMESLTTAGVGENISKFANAISQWDTFSWRDYPEFNTGCETDVMFLLSMYSPGDLIEMMESSYGHFIKHPNSELLNSSRLPIFMVDNPELQITLHTVQDAYENMLRWYMNEENGAWGTFGYGDRLYDVLVIPAPEKYISLIMHHMMNERKDYRDKATKNPYTFILAFYVSSGAVSLRTQSNDFSVGQLSKELFNGGGHAQAAGGKPSVDAMKSILSFWVDYLHSNNTKKE